MAFGDLDEDGEVDLVLVENGARVRLLEIVTPARHWVGVRLLETSGGDAQGARATLECARFASAGSRATAATAGNDARILCGLGDAQGPVQVKVHWVDRSEEHFGPLEPDQKHTLRKGTGNPGR